MTLTFGSLMAIVACVLFVIAALAAGALVTGIAAWVFGFGGFAALVLALKFPLPGVKSAPKRGISDDQR